VRRTSRNRRDHSAPAKARGARLEVLGNPASRTLARPPLACRGFTKVDDFGRHLNRAPHPYVLANRAMRALPASALRALCGRLDTASPRSPTGSGARDLSLRYVTHLCQRVRVPRPGRDVSQLFRYRHVMTLSWSTVSSRERRRQNSARSGDGLDAGQAVLQSRTKAGPCLIGRRRESVNW
jgi:hypothetical protein